MRGCCHAGGPAQGPGPTMGRCRAGRRSTWTMPRRPRSGARSSTRWCRSSSRASATRDPRTPPAASPAPRSTTPTSGSPPSSAPQAREIVFTSGRHRGEQPRAQGRRVGRQGARPSDRDLVGRAPRGRPHRSATSRSSASRSSSCRSTATAGSIPTSSSRRSTTDDPRLDHARQQRGGHDPADRRDRSPGCDRAQGVVLHVDAVQAAPYVDIDVEALGADLVSHRRAQVRGARRASARSTSGTARTSWRSSRAARQERHRRAGTEDVAGAVGLAAAYELTCDERPATAKRLRAPAGAAGRGGPGGRGVELTGHPKDRLPGLLSRGRPRHRRDVGRDVARPRGHRLLGRLGLHERLDRDVSHVLTAMGYPDEEARGALRLSLGRTTTDERSTLRPTSCRGSSPRCGSGARRSRRIRSARASPA